LIETGFGEKYLIAPDSVDKHIAYIEEVTPATGRDSSRPVATSRTLENKDILEPQVPTTSTDLPRQDATSPGMSRYVARLESENDFLRGQLGVKDTQRGPRIIATNRQAPRVYPRMIPLCSRFDSVLFTPKMSAIASYGNYSRSPK
jgi:hypothetical protein